MKKRMHEGARFTPPYLHSAGRHPGAYQSCLVVSLLFVERLKNKVMRCKITHAEQRTNEKRDVPYIVVKAVGMQGKEDAALFDEEDEDLINFDSIQSRVFNFTKTLFPNTIEKVEAYMNAFAVDEDGIPTTDKFINLGMFSWKAPVSFYIKNLDGEYYTESVKTQVEKVADMVKTIGGKVYQKGQKYTVEEVIEIPKVFDTVSLVILTNKEGKFVENDGEDPNVTAERTFKRGIENDVYVPVDNV